MQRAHPIYDATTFAIRFQTLAGQRYVDIRQPEKPAGELRSGDTIGTDRTIPSFDITTLFNGLEPVLAEFSPSALNRFTESMLAIIDGDSSGVGPALDEISKLSTYVTDRQAVISTLVHNLDEISQQLTDRSAQAITLLSGVTNVFSSLAQKVEGLIDFAVTAPPVFEPIDSIAATLGLTPGTNSDFDNAVRAAFPDPDTAIDVLGRLPGLLQSLNALLPSATSGVDLTCSNGAAEVPSSLQILLPQRPRRRFGANKPIPTAAESKRRELRMGIIGAALVAALLAAAGLFYVLPLGKSTYIAHMSEAGAIKAGDNVRIAGIPVGEVKSVELDSDDVTMKFTVDDDVFIGDATTLDIKMLTAAGGHYLAVTPVGTKPLGSTPIPADHVHLPYSLMRAFQDAATPIAQVDGNTFRKNLASLEASLTTSPDGLREIGRARRAVERRVGVRAPEDERLGVPGLRCRHGRLQGRLRLSLLPWMRHARPKPSVNE